MYDSDVDGPDFDFIIAQESINLVKVLPRTEQAVEWVEERTEHGMPEFGGSLYIHPSRVQETVECLQEEGYSVGWY